MHRRQGIAIIAVLLIMLAVFTLGLGALFLSRLNLRMSENVRSNSIVRYNTETGLDASMIVLEDYYVVYGEMPPGNTPPSILSNLSVATVGPDPGFTVFAYDRIDTDTARLSARSTLANGAEHVAELLVGIELDSNPSGGSAPNGLRSEGVVRITGQSTYLDAGVHGNLGFDIGNQGEFSICVDDDGDGDPDRDPVTGACTSPVSIPIADAPVSGSPGATICDPPALCTSGIPNTLIDPVVVNPDYIGKRDAAIDEMSQAIVGGTVSNIFVDSNGDPMYCDYVTPTAMTYTDLAGYVSTLQSSGIATPTMCLESGSAMSVPSGAMMTNMNIVSQGNIDFDSSVTITDSTLISMVGGVFDENAGGNSNNVDVALTDSSIFSQLGIDIHGSGSTYDGINTIASAGDITLHGQAPGVADGLGGIGVGLAIISEGNVEVNGGNNSQPADWFAVVVAGGTFTQNGTVNLTGGVEAVGDLNINGGIDIDSGLGVLNPIFDEDPTPVVVVISRR